MKSLLLATAFTILLTGLSTYLVAGASSNAVHNGAHSVQEKSRPAAADSAMNLASVENMVGGLEDRLRMNPADGKGWLLLAKSYHHMGRMDDARAAYEKAEALGSGDAIVAGLLVGIEDTEVSR